jgi:hypothetical protein
MICFVDLRNQNTGYQFAFFDTDQEAFLTFHGEQAFDSWTDFAAVCPVDEQFAYSRLCPDWVFAGHIDV